MTLTDWLAIIGAASWSPTLVFALVALIRLFRKQILRIYSYKNIEIGYSIYGSIINISLGLISDHSYTFIEKIALTLIHESKEESIFYWEWIEEIISQMDMPGNQVQYKKNQQAIALRIDQDFYIEKKIGFHNDKYKEKQRVLSNELIEEINNVQEGEVPNKVLETKCFKSLIANIENSFLWKPGNYKIKLDISTNKSVTFNHVIEFSLSESDVHTLRKNIELAKQYEKNIILNPEANMNLQWFWIFPQKKL
ncbi:hypothetical protein [Leptospira kmetyi]|uniref:hypothetical protein n=1 Tax=Leptospira kmetyi TaxID=408139 RepID=UPI001083AF03|nr:hypothetical protein [Leptospira kmetyi]TGL68527.1 hypothetical protein EHQ67_11415 [Leptospira kmetyi]